MKLIAVLGLLGSITYASAAVGAWGQCGGKNYNGDKSCVSGYKCNYLNEWYSQCVPGSSSSSGSGDSGNKTTTTNKKTSTTKVTKTKTSKTSSIKKTTTTTTKKSTQAPAPTYTPSGPVVVDRNLVGYATMNGGTTGGSGGSTVTVSSESDFIAAVKSNDPKIVKINGIIKISADIPVGSNTSIIGVGSNSGFTGAGLRLKKVSNIIIQNLKFSYCLGSNKDCISATGASNVWVDHNEFSSDRAHGKDYYDGLVDFTHASDYITISWNYIHDHYKCSLIGHSDSNSGEDSGKFHITYHHNYFKNLNSRLPSLRFGTGHIYNNVYENIDTSCINSRMGAQVLVEGNIFINAKRPLVTNLDSKLEGNAVARDNDYGEFADTVSITKVGSLNKAPYSCSVESSSGVYSKVVGGAGVGKI